MHWRLAARRQRVATINHMPRAHTPAPATRDVVNDAMQPGAATFSRGLCFLWRSRVRMCVLPDPAARCIGDLLRGLPYRYRPTATAPTETSLSCRWQRLASSSSATWPKARDGANVRIARSRDCQRFLRRPRRAIFPEETGASRQNGFSIFRAPRPPAVPASRARALPLRGLPP